MYHTHALGMVVVGAPPVRPVQGGAVRSTSAEPIATHSPTVPFRVSCINTDIVVPCPTARWGGCVTHGGGRWHGNAHTTYIPMPHRVCICCAMNIYGRCRMVRMPMYSSPRTVRSGMYSAISGMRVRSCALLPPVATMRTDGRSSVAKPCRRWVSSPQ